MGKKIEEINPDHIHIATEGPVGLWARTYLSKRGYRYNTAYHTKFPEGLSTLVGIPEFLTWKYIRWFHKHTGRVLTTTETMVNQLKSNGLQTEIVAWTRGVDREIFNADQRKKNNNITNLVCVSRISKEKNLEDFFRLNYPNSRKIMVGDGPMKDEYQQLYPDVEFVGYKTGKELAYYYANADVFVFPSTWETFGIVMIEAMACGTPIAAYPCQGPKDVVDQGITGCLDDRLTRAIDFCLDLDRSKVLEASQKWSWEEAWKIFKENLIQVV
jgi:glycosyltransferase involved in cell wall biosynthesis